MRDTETNAKHAAWCFTKGFILFLLRSHTRSTKIQRHTHTVYYNERYAYNNRETYIYICIVEKCSSFPYAFHVEFSFGLCLQLRVFFVGTFEPIGVRDAFACYRIIRSTPYSILVDYFSVFSIHRNVLASSTVTATSVVGNVLFLLLIRWFVQTSIQHIRSTKYTKSYVLCFLFSVCCYCSQAAFSTHSIS